MDAKLLKSIMDKKPNDTSNHRLESLRLPRDLSLGGTKRKKIIEPNLNSQRNKNKTKPSSIKLESSKKERLKPERRKKLPDNQRFVQSKGVFSEGSTLDIKKSSGFSNRSGYTNDSSTTMSKPVFKRGEIFDAYNEEDIIASFNGSAMELNDNNDDIPRWNYKREKNNNHIQMDTSGPYFDIVKQDAEINSRLVLFKLPQSLAGKGLSDDPNVKKLLDYNLNMMTEGRIGSLQITRSGKMYMKLGNMRYLLDEINCSGGPETITSYMEVPKEENNSKFVMFGDVEQRFDLVPQFTEL